MRYVALAFLLYFVPCNSRLKLYTVYSSEALVCSIGTKGEEL